MEAMRSDSLEALNSDYKQHITSIENLDNKSIHQETKSIHLVVAYWIVQIFIMQQATLTSIAWQPAVKRWICICLSAAISISFWLTFTITVNDWLRIKLQRDVRFMEMNELYRKIRSMRSGQCQDQVPATYEMFGKTLKILQYKRYMYVGIVNCTLLSLTVLVFYVLHSV